jgi:hypothetical protein
MIGNLKSKIQNGYAGEQGEQVNFGFRWFDVTHHRFWILD